MKNVYWIHHSRKPSVAIVARPRAEDWLEDDLLALKSSGIDVLVSLLEPNEAKELGLEREDELAEKVGMEFISFPIPDRTTPTNRHDFSKIISYLVDAVRSGKHIGAHCRGCIGRATVTTAAVLIELGSNPGDVLRMIEEARGFPVPDTEAQRRWILEYAPGVSGSQL